VGVLKAGDLLTFSLVCAAAIFAFIGAFRKLRQGRFKKQGPAMDIQTLREFYTTSALEYHVAARYAAFSGLSNVCGILFHHAMEMYLKGYLCSKLDVRQLTNLGHNLRKSWKAFKKDFSGSGLERFDETIHALDEHEFLRYPERVAPAGAMTIIINISKPKSQISNSKLNKGKQFDLVVDELDDLGKLILEKSKINAPVFVERFNGDAQEFLKRDNKSVIW